MYCLLRVRASFSPEMLQAGALKGLKRIKKGGGGGGVESGSAVSPV